MSKYDGDNRVSETEKPKDFGLCDPVCATCPFWVEIKATGQARCIKARDEHRYEDVMDFCLDWRPDWCPKVENGREGNHR
jgi:hypothetical protein